MKRFRAGVMVVLLAALVNLGALGCRQIKEEVIIVTPPSTDIVFSAEQRLVAVGGTRELAASYSDASNAKSPSIISWNSLDPGKATVDNQGKVTGISPGTVTIEAVSAENKKANIELTVYTLETSLIILEDEKTRSFQPTIVPANTVTLSELSGEEKAGGTGGFTIDRKSDGAFKLTGNGTGDAQLKITGPGGGSWEYPVVVVTPVITGPDRVDAGYDITLLTNPIPGKDMTQIAWSSSDSSVATVPSVQGASTVVTGVATGVVTITATLGAESWSHEVTVYNAFRTVWDLRGSGSTELVLPLHGVYDLLVDWGDGSEPESYVSEAYASSYPFREYLVTHDYGVEDRYTVQLYHLDGQLLDTSAWGFDMDRPETMACAPWLVDVEKWGNTQVGYKQEHKSLIGNRGFFLGCENLTAFSATDTPQLSGSLLSMFEGASNFNGDIVDWDTSNVTDLSRVFYYATQFNQPIGGDGSREGWNTSRVTSLDRTFYGASQFNQPLNNWNTSLVDTLAKTFAYASRFNQPLNQWDTGSVIDMEGMFEYATAFNGDISTWDTSKVRTMVHMFRFAKEFNQPINTDYEAGTWVTLSVRNTSSMFQGAEHFNQDISKWQMDNNHYFGYMFYKAISFNQPIDTTVDPDTGRVYWNMSSASTIAGMFSGATQFNQPLYNWNTSKVETMQNTFLNAQSFNKALDSWNTSNVTIMSGMFAGASSFNRDITSWNVNRVVYWGQFNTTTIYGTSALVDGNIPPKFR